MRAINNNRPASILDIFQEATRTYGVPSRVRGDHGMENVHLAAYMNHLRGRGRGSYIWGRLAVFFSLNLLTPS